MYPGDIHRLPIVPIPTVKHGYDFGEYTKLEYDEVRYDYNTNRYITLSQEQEIYRLKDQLDKQNEEKRRKLDNIIGYYYKR